MKKRVRRPTSQFSQEQGGYNLRDRKKNKHECNKILGLDRISSLPNEVLVSILSLLSLKEAQATSVLSRRWQHLWRHVLASTRTLDFDAEKTLCRLSNLRAGARDLLICRYVDWVNNVVEHHRGPMVETFRICFDLDPKFSSSLDKWIQFAMEKGVQMLELDLLSYGVFPRKFFPCYIFPHELLGIKKESTLKHLCSDIPSLHRCACIGFKSLTVLNFKSVDVEEEVLEYFLSNCPVLERLLVDDSPNLRNLRVVGPSVSLKYLVIEQCSSFISIEICDTNLVSFTYVGCEINMLLRNLPHLVEVCDFSYKSIGDAFTQLSCCLSQLEILKLNGLLFQERNHVFPVLANLKQLELKFQANDCFILLQLASFIKASPYLHRLVLELYPLCERRETRFKKASKCSHEYLRVVEIGGYDGRASDFEIVKYLIENAVQLEKIVIDPADPIEPHYCFPKHRIKKTIEEVEREENARNLARQQLIEKVPSTVEFVCL
ncbi:unnamed protein product [Prunus armeniaca]|nr:hypothetical protein GBA52_024148 [Prunus armeniaca]